MYAPVKTTYVAVPNWTPEGQMLVHSDPNLFSNWPHSLPIGRTVYSGSSLVGPGLRATSSYAKGFHILFPIGCKSSLLSQLGSKKFANLNKQFGWYVYAGNLKGLRWAGPKDRSPPCPPANKHLIRQRCPKTCE